VRDPHRGRVLADHCVGCGGSCDSDWLDRCLPYEAIARTDKDDARGTRQLSDDRWADGIAEPTGVEAVAAEVLEETRDLGQPVSALLCDIDAFRGLNERYGHEAGDRALKNIAEVLEESIGRRFEIVGRQGGDEFVILLPGIDLKAAITIAEGLCEACEARALVQQDRAAKFTISVGVGTEASGASDLGGLLRQTDAALYRAKRAGGNQVASGPERFVPRHSAPNIERFREALGQPLRTGFNKACNRGSMRSASEGHRVRARPHHGVEHPDLTLRMALVLRRAIT
jgi:diguanylate cyclase (GGDEF)-like protein